MSLISGNSDNKSMARTKVAVRRLPVKTHLPGWLFNREYGRRKTLPVQNKRNTTGKKTVNITKNGKIIKRINVKQKSRYFNGRNRLIF